MDLLDRYIHNLENATASATSKMSTPQIQKYNREVIEVAKQAERIYLEKSTMDMLMYHMQHIQDLIYTIKREYSGEEIVDAACRHVVRALFEEEGALWIQFSVPITAIDSIGGLFIYHTGHKDQTNDKIRMMLVDYEQALHTYHIFHLRDSWEYNNWQVMLCPWKSCKQEDGVLIPCETCEQIKAIWNVIFSISCLIIKQYLAARRYEEKTITTRYRKRSENPKKKGKLVQITSTYKIIDANEIIIPVVPANSTIHQKREGDSWLQLALLNNPESIEQKTIRTRPFTRTYRSERYRKELIGTTVEFKDGIERKQYVYKDRQHITKVKASQYEKLNQQKERE